jgi:hypothetical protein
MKHVLTVNGAIKGVSSNVFGLYLLICEDCKALKLSPPTGYQAATRVMRLRGEFHHVVAPVYRAVIQSVVNVKKREAKQFALEISV